MRKPKFYCQCRLTKSVGRGTIWEQVSFIPEEFARLGEILELKDANGVWTNGWKVVSVGNKMDAAYVESNERNWTKQREASDI